jgi:hypothetical protein
VISLVAEVRTAQGIGPAALRDVSAHLRSYDSVLCAPGRYLVTLGAGTALVEESRTALWIDFVVDSEDAAARACAALTREVHIAVGGFGIIVTWSRRDVAQFVRR